VSIHNRTIIGIPLMLVFIFVAIIGASSWHCWVVPHQVRTVDVVTMTPDSVPSLKAEYERDLSEVGKGASTSFPFAVAMTFTGIAGAIAFFVVLVVRE
jgi:hypothetical protein